MDQPTFSPAPLTPPPPTRRSPWVIVAMVLGGCAVLGLIMIAVLAAILFPVFANARDAARRTSCRSNMKQLGVSMQMYVQDYDETYPPAESWDNALQPYTKNAEPWTCPTRPQTSPGYAYNDWLSRRTIDTIENPAGTPVIFESSLGRLNGHDRLESFVTPHKRSSGAEGIVGMLDGTARGLASAPAHDGSGPLPDAGE